MKLTNLVGNCRKFSASIIVGIVYFWFFVYPAILTFLNWVPPSEEKLTTLHVHFLQAHGIPHLKVRLSDGSQQGLYFPDALYTVQRGTVESHLLTRTQQESLPGCDGTVSVSPVKGLWPKRTFVWSLRCGESYLSYDRVVSDYKSNLDRSQGWGIFWNVLAFSILIFVFLREAGVVTDAIMHKLNAPL